MAASIAANPPHRPVAVAAQPVRRRSRRRPAVPRTFKTCPLGPAPLWVTTPIARLASAPAGRPAYVPSHPPAGSIVQVIHSCSHPVDKWTSHDAPRRTEVAVASAGTDGLGD
jgi:hypothetical protein